jgi:aspartate-semialdehyde dehydrogenase
MAFGVARVDAPVGLNGLLSDEPLASVLISTLVAVGGAGAQPGRPARRVAVAARTRRLL